MFAIGQAHRDLGISRQAIARARRNGTVVRMAPDVLRFSSSPETFEMRCMALQLRFGSDGFLSAWTAGRLHGLRKMPAEPLHFTIPGDRRRDAPDWCEVHRSDWFDGSLDATRLAGGLIVATPLRMLFGLAAAYNQFRFERAAEDAWHRGLLTPSDAADYLEAHRCRGKDGVATLERWLDRALTYDRPAQSELERDLLEALDALPIPTPVRQHPLVLPSGETIHLDIAWPDIQLAVEPGASWWHGGDLGQRRDQSRDRACSEAGWLVIRFDESMRADLRSSARQVARIHGRRRRDLRKA